MRTSQLVWRETQNPLIVSPFLSSLQEQNRGRLQSLPSARALTMNRRSFVVNGAIKVFDPLTEASSSTFALVEHKPQP